MAHQATDVAGSGPDGRRTNSCAPPICQTESTDSFNLRCVEMTARSTSDPACQRANNCTSQLRTVRDKLDISLLKSTVVSSALLRNGTREFVGC